MPVGHVHAISCPPPRPSAAEEGNHAPRKMVAIGLNCSFSISSRSGQGATACEGDCAKTRGFPLQPPFGADGSASSNTVRKPSFKRYSPENHVFDKSDSKVRHYLLSYDIVYPAIRACDVVYRRIRRRGCVSRIRLAGDRLVKEVENPARFRMHRTAPSMGPSVLSWICVHDDRPASEPRAPLK